MPIQWLNLQKFVVSAAIFKPRTPRHIMRNTNLLLTLVALILWPNLSLLATDQEPKYTDYVPRYRSLSEQAMLERVAFFQDKTVFYIRYVAASSQEVQFGGASSKQGWQVQTPQRGRSVRVLQRATDAQNIRVNNELQHTAIKAEDAAGVTLRRGDLLTYELVFESMPSIVREVELSAKQNGALEALRLTNILLKTREGEYLGTESQMKQVIRRFNEKNTFMQHPDIVLPKSMPNPDATKVKAVATRNLGFIKEETSEVQAQEATAMRPKNLRVLSDLQCAERVILADVNFQDNKAQIIGRVRANRTLRLVVQHLSHHPNAKIVLHGHTDIHGNHYDNLALSRERVLNVRRALTQMGVDSRRILTFYYGGEHPLAGLSEGGAANRRVELEVICE